MLKKSRGFPFLVPKMISKWPKQKAAMTSQSIYQRILQRKTASPILSTTPMQNAHFYFSSWWSIYEESFLKHLQRESDNDVWNKIHPTSKTCAMRSPKWSETGGVKVGKWILGRHDPVEPLPPALELLPSVQKRRENAMILMLWSTMIWS